MKNPAIVLTVACGTAAVGLAAWHWRDAWWPGQAAAPTAVETPVALAPPAAAPPASAPGPAGPRHPIDAVAGDLPPEPAASGRAPPTLDDALVQLFGADVLATLFQREDFARRVVATVDNLGREKAGARLWPLQPPAGRFTTRRDGDTEVLAADNFVRYARHLALVQKVDERQVALLYKRHYARFQQAYEELGYPGRHFNDRLVEVIDLLLATPEPAAPVAVRQPPIQGPLRPERPWLIYEFADADRQAMPAGQQLLLRMGPDQARQVKAKLILLRRQLTR